LLVIDRMIAILSACLAIFGKCWLIRMPGTVVSISLNGPPFLWPGLRSNVSICDGPPDIHSRMTDFFFFFGSGPTARANAPNQPQTDPATTPAADSVIHSRRDRRGRSSIGRLLL